MNEERGEVMLRMRDHREVPGFRSAIAYQLLPGDPLIPADNAMRKTIMMNDEIIERNIEQIKIHF